MQTLIKYPGTVATTSSWNGVWFQDNWTSPDNVKADDSSYASVTASSFDTNDASYAMICSNFGFGIPSDAIIGGILVTINKRCGAGSAVDTLLYLSKNKTSPAGDDKGDTSTAWAGSLTDADYGSLSDLWGTTWTPAEINSSNFSVVFAGTAKSNDTDIYIDYIKVTIKYIGGPVSVKNYQYVKVSSGISVSERVR